MFSTVGIWYIQETILQNKKALVRMPQCRETLKHTNLTKMCDTIPCSWLNAYQSLRDSIDYHATGGDICGNSNIPHNSFAQLLYSTVCLLKFILTRPRDNTHSQTFIDRIENLQDRKWVSVSSQSPNEDGNRSSQSQGTGVSKLTKVAAKTWLWGNKLATFVYYNVWSKLNRSYLFTSSLPSLASIKFFLYFSKTSTI